jgi:hypothetical protein
MIEKYKNPHQWGYKQDWFKRQATGIYQEILHKKENPRRRAT